MPCISGIIKDGQLLIGVGISSAPANEGIKDNRIIAQALIDTGAQITCISGNLAQAMMFY